MTLGRRLQPFYQLAGWCPAGPLAYTSFLSVPHPTPTLHLVSLPALKVTLVGDRVVPIRPGKTLNLGPKVSAR